MTTLTGYDILVAVKERCDKTGVDPYKIEISHAATTNNATVTVSAIADVRAWADHDRVKVERRDQRTSFKCVEYSALYDRDGIGWLVIARIFDHCDDWAEAIA